MIFSYEIKEVHTNSVFELVDVLNQYGQEGLDVFQIQEVNDARDILDGRKIGERCYHVFTKKQLEGAFT